MRSFIADGFLRIDHAFTPETAAAARRILWRDTGCDPNDPGTWTQPVIRLGDYRDSPFVEAANTAALRAAYDQLVGKNRWRPRTSLGTFPIRFPSCVDPGDTGWHIDASFQGNATSPTTISARASTSFPGARRSAPSGKTTALPGTAAAVSRRAALPES